jgi:hypothetical protein
VSDQATSYYGRPIIKEPIWKPEVPIYFFFGGMAGAASTLVPIARAVGNARLASSAKTVAAIGMAVSPALLIKDLGRPSRFYNMLRVFKVRSPMSIGSWVLASQGTAVGVAVATQLADVLPRVRLAAETAAGVMGLPLSTYTGALVGNTVVPVWHEGRLELPFVFVGSAASAGGAATALLTPVEHARPARRLAVFGAVTELAAHRIMERRMGSFVAEPYRKGAGGTYSKLAERCTLAGAALMTLAGRGRLGAVAAGSLLLAGSVCQRFAVYHAGKLSAADPAYSSLPQKARAEERGQPAVTR